jgi:hypothetical protein
VVDDGATVCLRGAQPLRLSQGESVTFGRSPSCDLCIGAAATGQVEDTGVSRHAGTLRYDDIGATVTNTSASRAITVRPSVGQDRVVGSGEALTLARGSFAVILHGQVYVHTIEVDVGADVDADVVRSEVVVDDAPPTATIALNGRERRYCAALCEALLTERAAARPAPATYRHAGVRLGIAPASVRKVVDELRHRLIEQGFHGLDGDGARDALVHLLVETGTITTLDLALLR